MASKLKIINAIREAQDVAGQKEPSRELSMVKTKLDEALLWAKEMN